MKTRHLRLVLAILALLVAFGAQGVRAQELLKEGWAVIHIDDVKSGHIHMTRTRIQEDGAVRIQSAFESKLKISRMGAEIEMESKVAILETEEGKPVNFTTDMKQAGMPIEIAGEVRDGKLVITGKQMGVEQQTETDLDPETVGLYGVELLQKEKGLEAGTTYSAKVLLPEMGKVATVSATVIGEGTVDFLGEEMKLFRIDVTLDLLPGITITSWIDKDCNTRVEIVPLGAFTQKVYWGVSKEDALAEAAGGKLPDIMTQSFITPNHAMAHPRGIRSATYRLRPVKPSVPLPVEDKIQELVEKMEDGGAVIRITSPAPEGDTVPFPVEEPDLASYLKESVYLQCKDEALVAEAKKVVADEKDAYRAAKKLERWVYDNIDKKSLGVGFASAKEVFRDRAGDCSEHGVLLAAMTRAVGIPSRIACGVEYVFGIFGWHMWTEVWVGRWVPLDATLASPFVDATHIKFVQSALNDPTFDNSLLAMTGVLGNVEIDVLEYTLDGKTIKPDDPDAKPRIEGNAYTHPLMGISFQAPEGWTIDVGEGNTLAEIRPPEGDSMITVKAMALTYDNDLKKQIELFRKEGITTSERPDVGGHPGYNISIAGKQVVATQPSDMLYEFALSGPTEATEKIFEAFIGTVKIEK